MGPKHQNQKPIAGVSAHREVSSVDKENNSDEIEVDKSNADNMDNVDNESDVEIHNLKMQIVEETRKLYLGTTQSLSDVFNLFRKLEKIENVPHP